MSKEILNKVEEIGDLLNMIHGNQPKADTAFYELQKLKELLQAEEQESTWKMFRGLYRDYGIKFLSKLNASIKGDCKRSIIYWILDTPEQGANEIMQELKRSLKNE